MKEEEPLIEDPFYSCIGGYSVVYKAIELGRREINCHIYVNGKQLMRDGKPVTESLSKKWVAHTIREGKAFANEDELVFTFKFIEEPREF